MADDEERMVWSGFFAPLTDERIAEYIETHAERTARFPGGDSWQLSWLATNLQAGRVRESALRSALADLVEAADSEVDSWGETFSAAVGAARVLLGPDE